MMRRRGDWIGLLAGVFLCAGLVFGQSFQNLDFEDYDGGELFPGWEGVAILGPCVFPIGWSCVTLITTNEECSLYYTPINGRCSAMLSCGHATNSYPWLRQTGVVPTWATGIQFVVSGGVTTICTLGGYDLTTNCTGLASGLVLHQGDIRALAGSTSELYIALDSGDFGGGFHIDDFRFQPIPRTNYVSLSGSNIFPYRTWPEAATNINDAQAALNPGGVVLVSNGVYDTGEAVADIGSTILTARVAVAEGITVRSVNGPSETIIRGGTNLLCVVLESNAVLSGFTLSGVTSAWHAVYGSHDGIVESCVVRDCHTTSYLLFNLRANNCLIYSNYFYDAVHQSRVEHCVFSHNDGGYQFGFVGYFTGSTGVNTIVYGHTKSTDVGEAAFTNDPLFVDLAGCDFRLQSNSPCIDAGTNGYGGRDFDGVGRPLDGDNNGTAVADIGAFEYLHPDAQSDNDGYTDGEEERAGTNPADSNSYLHAIMPAAQGSNVIVNWRTAEQREYIVERSFDLTVGSWTSIVTGTITESNETPEGVESFLDPDSDTNFSAYYRIRLSE